MSYIKKLFLIPMFCIFCLKAEAQQVPVSFQGCTYNTGGFNAKIYQQRIGMSLSTLHSWFFKAAAPIANAIDTYDLSYRSSEEKSMLCMLYEVFSDRVHTAVKAAAGPWTIGIISSILGGAIVTATQAVLNKYQEYRGEKTIRAVRNLRNQHRQIVRNCKEGVYDYQNKQCRELVRVPICQVATSIKCSPNNEEEDSDEFFGLSPMSRNALT